MHTIFAQPGSDAHPDPDAAARQRADRLARANAEQMEMALSFLSRIDPEAFEIVLNAAAPTDGDIHEDHEDEEAIPLCRRCGGLVGIFLSRGLNWQHFRGDGVTSGAQRIYDPAIPPRSPGSSPVRTRKNSSQPLSPQRPAGLSGGALSAYCLAHRPFAAGDLASDDDLGVAATVGDGLG
jgi:hypothetical protein